MCVDLVTNYKKNLTSVLANKGYSTQYCHILLGVQILIFCITCKLSHKCYKMQFSDFLFLIFCFSLLKYTYYYNYRSHISLQVAKLAKSAGVQILIFPTVYIQSITDQSAFRELLLLCIITVCECSVMPVVTFYLPPLSHTFIQAAEPGPNWLDVPY